MDTRILEIVFYLMDYMQDGDDQLSLLTEYSTDLRNLGYSEAEISNAYSWILDHLSAAGESLYVAFPEKPGSCRILTEIERSRLSADAHAYLLRMQNLGLMSAEQQERILDRIALFGPRSVTIEQVKLITSAVVFDEQRDLGSYSIKDSVAEFSSQVN